LVHFCVPLAIGNEHFGALVAGQVFDQFPEALVLEQVADKLGISPNKLWQLARLERPIKVDTLGVYADLLHTLANRVLQGQYHLLRADERLAGMTRLHQELRQRTQELTEADERKDQFLAMLAHELRNPLAPIRNAVELLRRSNSSDENVQCSAEVLDHQVQHMTRLLEDLLDISRLIRGKIILQKQLIDLAEVVERAIETSRPVIDERQHKLTVICPKHIYLQADAIRLAQVLANLLNNAARYTPEGGRISLTVLREKDAATIRVHDTGIGIPADMLNRIFDLFTQVDSTLDRSQGGLGLGLTLVRNMVEMHGGSVEALSSGANQGSEFVVRLPISEQLKTPAADVGRMQITSCSTKRRILVVDDNTDAARTLARLLRFEGHEVTTAHDGLMALEAASTHHPEIILLDIGLPKMDGYEVMRRVRLQPATKDCLVIALTGYGQENDRRMSREAGFDHHLVKPVDFRALEELMSSVELPDIADRC